LFNSLTAIARLCDKDPGMAKEMTLEFSQYLRGNMDSLTENDLIPFKQELKHTKIYISIEKAIYGKGLNVIYNIEVSDFELPPLTLQPIVENAVKHGIGRREGGGTVTISTRETDTDFELIVTDDGLGFESINPYMGSGVKGENKQISIGVANVKNRLSAMCGGSLVIESELGVGSTVIIKIPKKTSDYFVVPLLCIGL
jgi:LytS/YehU family sensor histidine kinase